MRRFVPLLTWLPSYRRDWLAGDLTAGLITAIMLVPQGMAYGALAGLTPQTGLYASILPLAAYAVFGTSRTLAVGPVALVSLMTATAIAPLAEAGSAAALAAALVLAAQIGLLSVAFGLARLGFLVNFLSHPVISGFTSAAALIIGLGQLKHLLGVSAPRSQNVARILGDAADRLGDANPTTLAIGVGTVALLLLARGPLAGVLVRLGLRPSWAGTLAKTGPLIAVALATLLVWGLALDQRAGVAIVGAIPAGLPPLTLPVLDPELWRRLLPSALLIAGVGFLESVSVAKALASKRRQKIDPDQELIALGAANLASACSGGYPITGGFARSGVNFAAGANTPLAAVVTAALVALTVVLLTPLFHFLPRAVLAAIIITAVLNLIDTRAFVLAWRYSKADGLSLAATFAAVLAFGIEPGILAGVGLSLALFLWRTSRPHVAEVGRVGDTEHFRNVLRHRVITDPGVLAIRIDESLYFANARRLEDEILGRVADRPALRHVVLICSAVNLIDASALESLEILVEELRESGVTLHLAEVKGPVMDRLRRSDFLERLEPGRVFLSTHEAMVALALPAAAAA